MDHGRAGGIPVNTEDLPRVGTAPRHSLARARGGVAACLPAHQSLSRDDLLWRDSDI